MRGSQLIGLNLVTRHRGGRDSILEPQAAWGKDAVIRGFRLQSGCNSLFVPHKSLVETWPRG